MGRTKSTALLLTAVVFALAKSTLAQDAAPFQVPASDIDAPLFQLSLRGNSSSWQPGLLLPNVLPAKGSEGDLIPDLSINDSFAPQQPKWLDVSREADTKACCFTLPAPGFLRKGTWDVELSGAHMAAVRSERDDFDSGSAALGYFIWSNFSLNAAFVGYSVNQPDNNAFAGGFDLYARYYFLTLARFTFYADIGAGAFMADKEVPEHGTHFNFTPRGGMGAGYRLYENIYLLGGVRYWHLSNAGIHDGVGRNPSFNSVQYYGSIMFVF